ncbi:telomere-associated protein RIF1-like [Acanthaster planci]|uniref:Telomere-associated protein RIF1-like n=1 Tax=Acanthaster planci TaxID=133434 RepID=A0A8B7YDY7_ACAPL|nr:telomere-associated protein RIF1-like [Acanthaster planci]
MDKESQSKQGSNLSLNKDGETSVSASQTDHGSDGRSATVRRVSGKKHLTAKQKLTKSHTTTEENANMNLSDSYAADESIVEDSKEPKSKTDKRGSHTLGPGEGAQADCQVKKKRGRPRKAKPAVLSPVEETPVCLDVEDKVKSIESNCSSKRSGTELSKEEQQEAQMCEEPQRGPPADTSEDTALEPQNVEKNADLKQSQEGQDLVSSSSIPNSQDQQLNSSDDLFESCPKDIPDGGMLKTMQMSSKSEEPPASKRTIKRTRRLSRSKLGLGKRKCRNWEGEEDSEEDNIPLAKIRHCYLDVDSQTSDSEVDFPKKKLERANNENPRIIEDQDEVELEDTKREQLTCVNSRSEKTSVGKSPKLSPKTSPKAAFAKKILRRARKSPLFTKASPAKIVSNAKTTAKISPVATRLRTSKHLSSLSASVPSKLRRRPRKVLKAGQEKHDHSKPSIKFGFEEKLEKAVTDNILGEMFPGETGDLWEDLSPIAGLSTSLPLPDSKSLLSPSPVSFIEEDIQEKDIGLNNEVALLLSGIAPPGTREEMRLGTASKLPDLDSETAGNEELLSSSLLVSEKILDPKEGMEYSKAPSTSSQSILLPVSSETYTGDSTEKQEDSAAEGATPPASECLTSSVEAAALPKSPVIPLKFAPSCHSSPNVSSAAKAKPADQGSPSGSIPSMYSPAGSPSGGILKRRDSASPSPSNKSRRVSFAEPISEQSPVKQFAVELLPSEPAEDKTSKSQRITHPPSPLVTTTPSRVVSLHSKFITTPSRRSSSGGFGAKSRISPSGRRISPGTARWKAKQHGFVTPSTGRKTKPIRQSSQNTEGTPLTQQNSLDNSIDSDYDNQESVFPDLADCSTPVERVLPQLTSSMWSRGLGQLVRARNILTVGHLCSLSPTEIRSLPIRSPKISNLRKVMTNFQRLQSAKSGAPLVDSKKKEELPGEDEAKGRGAETKATEGRKEVGESAADKADRQALAVSSELSTSRAASSEKEEPHPKQGTKRKHDELEESSSGLAEGEQLPKQARIMDKLADLVGELATENLAELPSDRLFLAHQHVNNMMESIMAALKVKVKSPSLSS